jgi:hypothetical protein
MSNPTSNYSFQMPTSTDLVTDLPADFEVFGQAVDTQMKTNADAATQKSTLTTKGDIYAATGASTPARLAVGSNDQVLIADSTTATGLKWGSAAAGGYTTISSGNLNGSSTVTISSIPATYRSIVLVILNPTTATGSQYLQGRMNGNTTNYKLTKFNSNGTSLTSQGATTFWYLDNQDQTIGSVANDSSYVLTFNEYANTGAIKSVMLNNCLGAVGASMFGTASNNANSNAITSLSILTSGGANFSGGTYVLYGVK